MWRRRSLQSSRKIDPAERKAVAREGVQSSHFVICSERIPSSVSYPRTLADNFPSQSCRYWTRCEKCLFVSRIPRRHPFNDSIQVVAIHHVTADSQPLRLTYRDFADRSSGIAYYLRKHGHKHVGILCPNTPAFLISVFGIAAAGAVITAADHQLDIDDIEYIFDHSNVDAIIVDREFVGLVDGYKRNHPAVKLIVDEDRDKEGQFYDAVKEGQQYDKQTGGNGWGQLETRVVDDNSLIAVAYTSG